MQADAWAALGTCVAAGFVGVTFIIADAARLLVIGGAPASVRPRDDVRARALAHQ